MYALDKSGHTVGCVNVPKVLRLFLSIPNPFHLLNEKNPTFCMLLVKFPSC